MATRKVTSPGQLSSSGGGANGGSRAFVPLVAATKSALSGPSPAASPAMSRSPISIGRRSMASGITRAHARWRGLPDVDPEGWPPLRPPDLFETLGSPPEAPTVSVDASSQTGLPTCLPELASLALENGERLVPGLGQRLSCDDLRALVSGTLLASAGLSLGQIQDLALDSTAKVTQGGLPCAVKGRRTKGQTQSRYPPESGRKSATPKPARRPSSGRIQQGRGSGSGFVHQTSPTPHVLAPPTPPPNSRLVKKNTRQERQPKTSAGGRGGGGGRRGGKSGKLSPSDMASKEGRTPAPVTTGELGKVRPSQLRGTLSVRGGATTGTAPRANRSPPLARLRSRIASKMLRSLDTKVSGSPLKEWLGVQESDVHSFLKGKSEEELRGWGQPGTAGQPNYLERSGFLDQPRFAQSWADQVATEEWYQAYVARRDLRARRAHCREKALQPHFSLVCGTPASWKELTVLLAGLSPTALQKILKVPGLNAKVTPPRVSLAPGPREKGLGRYVRVTWDFPDFSELTRCPVPPAHPYYLGGNRFRCLMTSAPAPGSQDGGELWLVFASTNTHPALLAGVRGAVFPVIGALFDRPTQTGDSLLAGPTVEEGGSDDWGLSEEFLLSSQDLLGGRPASVPVADACQKVETPDDGCQPD